jgi:hypothetical protein
VENKNSELLVHDLRFGKMGIKPEADYIFSFQISENEGKVVIKEKERGDGFSSGEFKNFLRRIFSHTKNKNSSS